MEEAKNTPKKKNVRPPDSSGVKKIDFKQPELPSKHKQSDSVSVSSRKPKTSHTRNSSSISRADTTSSPGRKKAPTPEVETDIDDGVSVADSLMSGKFIRRTEQERIEYFKNQPECDPSCLEPHRVKCLRCGKWVSLGSKQTYTVKPWEKHRSRCDQHVPQHLFGDNQSEAGSVAPSVAKSEASTRRTLAERKAFFEADTRCAEVQPDQALCKRCQKWIRLSTKQAYALYNWHSHQSTCSESMPSDRVTAAERKLRLVNDKDARPGFTTHSVQCARCDTTVILEGDGDFNLTNWELHKSSCTKSPSKSSVSLEAGSSPRKGKKRALEDDGPSTEVVDERPTNRPRTESYEAPDQESPGPFGWFMAPFKAFINGFKDSLSAPP